jgi:two-component system, NarL family, sensor histidine kinase DesK
MARAQGETAKTTGGRDTVGASATPDASVEAPLRRLLPFAWPVFAAMWLVFPVGVAAGALRAGSFAPAGLLAFLFSMAAYAVVYLWLVLRYPFRGEVASPGERAIKNALLAILTALALWLALAYGDAMPRGVPYHFMFVVIAAAVVLPAPRAAWAVAAVAALAGAIYALRSGWAALASGWEFAIAPFVIVGFSMILVGRLVVTVRELQVAREEIARLAVSEERLRFARDLHDLLGHSLSLITLKSELAERLLPDVPENEGAAKELRDLQGVARGALSEVREAVAGYRRPTLDEELAGARGMLRAAGVACKIENGAGELPDETGAVLAWAVREGVTNVVRHSRARRCEVRLAREGDQRVRAEVTDDGSGPPPASEGEAGGSGLSGLAERVASFPGAIFEAGPSSQGGFRLLVVLPLQGPFSPATAQEAHPDRRAAAKEARP